MTATPSARLSSRMVAVTVALVAALALLAVTGCGTPDKAFTGPTPTTPPNATHCAQVYGFANARPVNIPGMRFPPGTVAISRISGQGATTLTIAEYRVCVPNGELPIDPSLDARIFAGAWQYTTSFPADGRHLSPCAPDAADRFLRCALLPATMVYARIDQLVPQGQGLAVFRLQLAHPPHPCDNAVYAPAREGDDIGYSGMAAPLLPLDPTQVPLPPLSLQGTAAVGFQPVDTGQVPYARQPVCTQGTRASILADMRAALPGLGWSPTSGDGTAWAKQIPGGWLLELRLTGLDTPQSWTILMGPRLDLPPPPFPTPVPGGANADCSSVPGLQGAGALYIPDVVLPANTIGIASTTVSGPGKYTVVDYFICAPDFELSANPMFGSGGYPLGQILPQTYWDDAGSFPFDGVSFQPCDDHMVGNYLNQLCRSHSTTRYVIEQQVTEPGKGLVAFHLLIASAPR